MQKKLSFVGAKIAIEQLLGAHGFKVKVINDSPPSVYLNDEPEARFWAPTWMEVYRKVLDFASTLSHE